MWEVESEIDREYQKVLRNNVVVRDATQHAMDVELDRERQYRAVILALDKAYRALIESVVSLVGDAAKNQEGER